MAGPDQQGADQQVMGRLDALTAARWERLPPVPAATEPGPGQNGTVVVLDGRPYVATFSGTRQRFYGEIMEFLDGRWKRHVGGRRLNLGQSGTLSLVVYRQTVCVGVDRAGLRVQCLKGGRWRPLGSPVWHSARRSGLGQLVAIGDTLYALRGYAERDRHSRFGVSEYNGKGWRDVSPPQELTGRQNIGMQPFANGDRYCVAFQNVEHPTAPSIRTVCRGPSALWSVATPETALSGLGPDVTAADLDSAVATDGVIYLGADVYRQDEARMTLREPGTRPRPQIDWKVFRTPDQETKLSSSVYNVTEQGRLLSSHGLVWGYAFSQHQTKPDIEGWMSVSAMDPQSGAAVAVGQPLTRRFTFNGPVDWELASDDSTVFALFTTAVHGPPGQSTQIGLARLTLAPEHRLPPSNGG